MLSPEHVRARRRGNELKVQGLDAAGRERAVALARVLIEFAREGLGRSREELEEAWSSVAVAPREKRLLSGLAKLVEDGCDFEANQSLDPVALRQEVFLLAAARHAGEGEFDRNGVLSDVAARHDIAPLALEAALYTDLRGAQRLASSTLPSAEELVNGYERAQVQAVLLRAVRVSAEVRGASADAYRDLFRQLKFRRLMHRIEPLEGGGYRIEIDGPFSLFQSVAKYGLELALMLPALESCGTLELEADVRWSDRGKPLVFRHRAVAPERGTSAPIVRSEVSELLEALSQADPAWSAKLSERVLTLPGAGVCVPDLLLERRDGAKILLEIMGFWSRDAVFARIELVERGLAERVMFAVSSRLRVSEELLEDAEGAALYVYKGRINPRALLRRADELVAKPSRA
jgi:predicted nuclease of restriction endonuclease-like RecB superfamily